MQKRWGIKAASDLPVDHKGWDLEAMYLAYCCANCILAISPQKIIMGGGVMKRKELFPKIQAKTKELLNGYIKHAKILNNIQDYIVAPGLGDQSGICGAIALAEQKYAEEQQRNK
jgi:fructokinase